MAVTLNGTSGVSFNDGSTQATAATGFGFKNRIINGAMVIDQRNAGASVTPANGAYTLDRWRTEQNGGGVYTVQQSTTAPAGYKNSLLVTVTTADASIAAGDYYDFEQFVEGFNTADLAWGTASASPVTLSFWVRSSVTGTFAGSMSNSAATRCYVFTYTINAANTWEQKTVTVPGCTDGTWLTDNGRGISVYFDLGNGSTYQGAAGSWLTSYAIGTSTSVKLISTVGATMYITGVQLEAGTTATPFEQRLYGTELALCQRYFISYGGSVAYERFGTCLCQSTTTAIVIATFPVEMRAAPTFGYSSAGNLVIFTGTSVITVTSIGGDSPSPKIGTTQFAVASGLTAGATYQAVANNTTSARVTWSAEL